MPTPKPVDRYHDLFPRAFRKVYLTGRAVMQFDTEQIAKNIRAQFYAFRESLYREPEAYPELTLIAPYFEVSIKSSHDKWVLTIQKGSSDE